MQHSGYHDTTAVEEDYDEVMKNIYKIASQDLLPLDHINFLEHVLKKLFDIEPDVIYDIGSCCLHWERHARRIWSDAKVYCFDAFDKLEPLYIKIIFIIISVVYPIKITLMLDGMKMS